ncbi:MAG: hypothetical protein F6K58_09035 [Symploca sp. SIO2E9]|nr:hypothetical protein [Symploca sp. SIO2E9]
MGEQVSRRSRRGDVETLQTRRIKIPTKISLTREMGRGGDFCIQIPLTLPILPTPLLGRLKWL